MFFIGGKFAGATSTNISW